MTEEELDAEQKIYDQHVADHRSRMEAWARALYSVAQLKGMSHITYEQVLEHVFENSSDDYQCEPSPREWAKMQKEASS
jgi:hypothetical protein